MNDILAIDMESLLLLQANKLKKIDKNQTIAELIRRIHKVQAAAVFL